MIKLFQFIIISFKVDVNSNPFEMINALVLVILTFMVLWIFCFYGGMVTEQFDSFKDHHCQCDWYLYPIEVQQSLVILLANAQKPAHIRGFGNVVCARDTFQKVVFWLNSFFFLFQIIFNFIYFHFRQLIKRFRIL